MDKNILLETLEYNLKDFMENKGESVDKFLYDNGKLKVPTILYLTSQYIYEKLLTFKLYYTPKGTKFYPFVTSDGTEPNITQDNDVWIQAKNGKKPVNEYSGRAECLDVLIAHMLLECYYSYNVDSEEKDYVPDDFYNCVLSMLFLFVPATYIEFIKNYDKNKMSTCEKALKNILDFTTEFRIMKDEVFFSKMLDEDSLIGSHFKNAVDLFARRVDSNSLCFKTGLVILKDQITIFNLTFEKCIKNKS